MSGDAAHAPRRGVVHDASQHRAVFVILGRRDARGPLCGRQEAGVVHAERREDVLGGVVIQRHAGDFFDEEPERLEVNVAVEEARAWRIGRLLLHGPGEGCVATLPWLLQIEIGAKAGVMGEQLADGDVFLAVLREVRKVGGDGIVQPELSLLNQLHDRGRGGDALGERGDVEDRIDGHGFAGGLERPRAEGLAVDDAAVVADEYDSTGDEAAGDRLLHDRVDRGEGAWGRFLCVMRRCLGCCRNAEQERDESGALKVRDWGAAERAEVRQREQHLVPWRLGVCFDLLHWA